MTALIAVASGGALGTYGVIAWRTRSAPIWVVITINCAVCAVMGAFLSAVPNPSGGSAALLGFGLLTAAATPVSLLFPLPRIGDHGAVREVARRFSTTLAITSLYGCAAALAGYVFMQAMTMFFQKAT
jgi:hypothetical protein